MQGTVAKKFDKGFGFIREEHVRNGKDLFFHAKSCKTLFDNIQVGDKVMYEVEDSPKGRNAVNVRWIED